MARFEEMSKIETPPEPAETEEKPEPEFKVVEKRKIGEEELTKAREALGKAYGEKGPKTEEKIKEEKEIEAYTEEKKKEIEAYTKEKRKELETKETEKEAPEAAAEEPLPGELELGVREARKEAEEAKAEKPEKAEAVSEKTKEQILDEAREKFAQIDLDAEKYTKIERESLGQKKTKEGFEGYKEKKEAYLGAIKNRRVEMYEEALKKLEKLGLSEKKAEEELRKEMKEITKETIVKEADKLYSQKTDLKLETKGEPSKMEKMKDVAANVVEKYRKIPLKYKLLITAGLLGGGLVAGAVGGATGAAMITGLAAGRWFQRAFGGAAAAVGLEALIKRSQEKKTEKEISAELAGKLEESIKNGDKKLDEKLLELEGRKKGEKRRRYILSGIMGGLVGSGAAAETFRTIVPDAWIDGIKDKLGMGPVEAEGVKAPVPEAAVPEAAVPEAAVPEAAVPEALVPDAEALEGERPAPISGTSPEKAPVITEFDETEEARAAEGAGMQPEASEVSKAGFMETAGKGDSIWKMAEDQLEKHYGEKFAGLDIARKTYIIDAIKDKIAENPGKFGLDDVDKLKVGQKVDFSSILEDKAGIEKVFEKAGVLKQAAIENIEKNNQLLKDWVENNPDKKLTSAKVDEILAGKEVPAAPEAPPVEAPAEEIPGPEAEEKEAIRIREEAEKKILEEREALKLSPEEREALRRETKLEDIVKQAEELETKAEAIAKKVDRLVNVLDLNKGEWEEIGKVKTGELLDKLPSRNEAWEIWRSKKSIGLPSHGAYGISEFKHHLDLVDYIRSFGEISEPMKEMTVKQFFQLLAGKGLPEMTISDLR